MLAQVPIFNNNSIYVYFLSCIVIFNYQHFSKYQKISLIYATTIAMELISNFSFGITSVMLFISMFILEEYLSDDKVKCDLLRNIWYKVLDFIYQFIFIDVGIGIFVNIILSSKEIRDLCFKNEIPISVYYSANITILLVTIHIINTTQFSLHEFGVIKSYFDKFEGRKILWDSYELQQRFDILVQLEDKSFFDRKQSYNWLSMEFVKYKIKAYKENRVWQKQFREKQSLRHILKTVLRLIRQFRLIRYVVGKIKWKIDESTWSVKYFFRRINRKIRGCSTLEMQLIRNIGIEKGYDKCVIRRKIYEFFYTYLFFNGLKSYYENTSNNKRKEFKKYILYVYLHSIRLSMFGNEFKSIDKLFEQDKVEEWDINELYIAILSLTGATVSPKRMVLYPYVVNHIGVDLNRALVWRNMIKDFRITETEKSEFDESEVKRVFYVIQDAILPFVENGKFYGPNDGYTDWPSYGEYNCWNFARSVYWHIWCEHFSNKTGTDDDMMRKYHSLSDRMITPEHCKLYLGNAEPGAVIRICDEIKGNDRMGINKHSQILLFHDENGVSIYESDNEKTSIEYYTWNQYSEKYAKYKFFKYIKWPEYI